MQVAFTYTPHPGETRHVNIDVDEFSISFENFIVSIDKKELKIYTRIYSERMQQGYANAPSCVLPNHRITEVDGRYVIDTGGDNARN